MIAELWQRCKELAELKYDAHNIETQLDSRISSHNQIEHKKARLMKMLASRTESYTKLEHDKASLTKERDDLQRVNVTIKETAATADELRNEKIKLHRKLKALHKVPSN